MPEEANTWRYAKGKHIVLIILLTFRLQFEHFPVREILKEGVKDECQGDDDFGAFGGDWGQLDEEYNNGEESDFSDYVQPTKKPLIFLPSFP